jgi:hypothetical protein
MQNSIPRLNRLVKNMLKMCERNPVHEINDTVLGFDQRTWLKLSYNFRFRDLFPHWAPHELMPKVDQLTLKDDCN